MKQLLDTIEGLFMAASIAGGDAVDPINYALKHIKWHKKLTLPEPQSHPIIDAQLEGACANSGQYGSNPHMVAEAVMAAKDQLRWNTGYGDREDEPDMAALTRNWVWSGLIGAHAPLQCDQVEAGLAFQGRDTYYPPHAHQAVETYFIIGGDGDWKVGVDPWFPVEPGDEIHHETGVRHAMQTNAEPMLAIWLWTSHLDSDVVIVRG